MSELSRRLWLSLNESHDIDAHVARRYRQMGSRSHRSGYLLSLMRLGAALERGDINAANLDGAISMHRIAFDANQNAAAEPPKVAPAKAKPTRENLGQAKPAASIGRQPEPRESIPVSNAPAAQAEPPKTADAMQDRAKVRVALNGLLGRPSGMKNETVP